MTTITTKSNIKFPGICRDAKKLGVERTHLYRVLTGKRISVSLMKRYKALKSTQGGTKTCK